MHEATIAQAILEIANDKLKATPHAAAILAIHVIIGEFRNVELDSLMFAFDNIKLVSDTTRQCRLVAEIVNAKAACRGAGHLYHPTFDNSFRCPRCDNGIGKLLCGEELDVIQLTLQAEDEPTAGEHKGEPNDNEVDTYARVT